MKRAIKIIAFAMLIIVINFAILVKTVQAVGGEQINIYTKGEFKRIIRFNGIVVKTANAVYQKDGQEHPAYCLNKDLHGVGEHIATYDVTEQGKVTDLGLWRVIINGYPYKTPEQLGVADEGEAYTATKQAIYCYIYNRGTENYEGIGDAGNRVINAINKILENARNSTESFENQNIEIIQSENWEVDSNESQYISKTYEVKTGININKFIISLENQLQGTKITNLENQEKNEFNSNEKFKILIPIRNLEKAGEFKVKIQTQMETKPIYYGKAPSADLQDYALTAYSFEDVSTEMLQNYEKNQTKIILEKQDSETKEPLSGAKFEILNENKKVIKVVETNKEGQIILEQLMPGVYYIREVQAPDGYELDSEEKQVEIRMNEEKTIKIENIKIVIEEPPIVEEEEPQIEEPPVVEEEPVVEEPPVIDEVPVVEEPPIIEVPKLPVTGM